MDSMLERWKGAINSVDEKLSAPSIPLPSPDETNLKKSLEKSKRSLHSNHPKVSSSKRLTTPAKSKPSKKLHNPHLQRAEQQIVHLIGASHFDKDTSSKLMQILSELWVRASEVETQLLESASCLQEPEPLLQESTASVTKRKHEKLYQDLERKYFECEKERQFLKGRAESLVKKCEGLQKQLEKFEKMERLVDACLERENQLKLECKELRQGLRNAEARNDEQQKVFQQEIMTVHQLVESIRRNLPKS